MKPAIFYFPLRIGLLLTLLSGYFQGCKAADSSTPPSSTNSNIPSRADSIATGDKVKLEVDTPIFTFEEATKSAADVDGASKDSKTPSPHKACAPAGSYFEVAEAPTPKTTTTVTPASKDAAKDSSGSKPSTPVSSVKGANATIKTTAVAAGDQIETKTQTVASATILRVGGSWVDTLLGKKKKTACVSQMDGQTSLSGYQSVVENGTYEFVVDDLNKYRNHRFGWTYGGLVVPNKLVIADRSFSTSTSVFPYVGYENWGTGVSGTVVLAAGIGTAPATTQSPTTGTSTSATKAVFSVAVGEIFKFGTVFRAGVLIGTDTAGSKTGYKYQGKPWIGITLGAGS